MDYNTSKWILWESNLGIKNLTFNPVTQNTQASNLKNCSDFITLKFDNLTQ